jgi:hypothetical protein
MRERSEAFLGVLRIDVRRSGSPRYSFFETTGADDGLNTATFNACLDSGKYADAIQKDKEEGRKAGVSSTPTLFINGRMLRKQALR